MSMAPGSRNLPLYDLLRDVSRSFYWTPRILPADIRLQVSLAYLLARAADSIADTRILPQPERLKRLLRFRDLMREKNREETLHGLEEMIPPSEADHSTPSMSSTLGAERRLLQHLPQCFDLLRSLTETDRHLVSEVVEELTVGMELDLRRFPDDESLGALRTFEELEDYTYHVAGCVGPFWTRMCIAHLAAFRTWNTDRMCNLGIRFGKALQWTNILRDIPRDLQNGRCYLPSTGLGEVGLTPADLKNPDAYEKLKPLYLRYLNHALEHYTAAWEYTMAIPKSCPRVRLACIWPIWIGLETLSLLRHSTNPLDPTRRIRIPRSRVYAILLLGVLCVKSDRMLNTHYHQRLP